MKKFLAAALASMMLIGGAALALADGELNICSPEQRRPALHHPGV